jgi:hypothetical protein
MSEIPGKQRMRVPAGRRLITDDPKPLPGRPRGARKSKKLKSLYTISIPEAGLKFFGIGRNASYDAARRGEIPWIQVGRLKRVPIAAMEERLKR